MVKNLTARHVIPALPKSPCTVKQGEKKKKEINLAKRESDSEQKKMSIYRQSVSVVTELQLHCHKVGF